MKDRRKQPRAPLCLNNDKGIDLESAHSRDLERSAAYQAILAVLLSGSDHQLQRQSWRLSLQEVWFNGLRGQPKQAKHKRSSHRRFPTA